MFFLKKFKKGKRGVTLLEIILVLAILAILAASSVGGLSAYRGKQVLSGETSQVAAIFSKARSQTLASRSELSYGVRLETDRVTLYTGPTFDSVPGTREEYVLHNMVNLTDISLSGGGTDVLFERLTGETASYGTFRVTLLSDTSQHNTFSIKQTGLTGLEN